MESLFFYLVSVMGCVSAKYLQFNSCAGEDSSLCTVEELYISNCKKSTSPHCILDQTTNGTFSVTFIPHFFAHKVKLSLFVIYRGMSISLEDLHIVDPNVCPYVGCPVLKDVGYKLTQPLRFNQAKAVREKEYPKVKPTGYADRIGSPRNKWPLPVEGQIDPGTRDKGTSSLHDVEPISNGPKIAKLVIWNERSPKENCCFVTVIEFGLPQ